MGVQQPSSNNNHVDTPTTCSTYDISATTTCPSKPHDHGESTTPAPPGDQTANSNKLRKLRLVSYNIEGFRSSKPFLTLLEKMSDILCNIFAM